MVVLLFDQVHGLIDFSIFICDKVFSCNLHLTGILRVGFFGFSLAADQQIDIIWGGLINFCKGRILGIKIVCLRLRCLNLWNSFTMWCII